MLKFVLRVYCVVGWMISVAKSKEEEEEENKELEG